MKILLFGVSQVGKSTVGKILAKRLKLQFIDLDQILFNEYGSIENFQKKYLNKEKRFAKKMDIVIRLCQTNDNFVFAVSPIFSIYEHIRFRSLINDSICFNLTASKDALFNRIQYYDENMKVLPDSDDYKNDNKIFILREIDYDNLANKEEFSFYKQINTTKLSPEDVATRIIRLLKL